MDEESKARLDALRQEMREYEKQKRRRRLRRGLAKPRTMKEFEIFAADLVNKGQAASGSRRTRRDGSCQHRANATVLHCSEAV